LSAVCAADIRQRKRHVDDAACSKLWLVHITCSQPGRLWILKHYGDVILYRVFTLLRVL